MKFNVSFLTLMLNLLPIKAAEFPEEHQSIQTRINGFALPQETSDWAESIMRLVKDVLPKDQDAINKFQELVDWSCGEHADLKKANPARRAQTIKFSLNKLLEIADSSARVTYITEQLNRHKQYVPK